MPVFQTVIDKSKFLLIRVVIPAFFRALFYPISRKAQTLLIVKCDGIGDYVLFRNYISSIKNSERYSKHELILLANESGKDLALYLDKDVVDKFLWYSDGYFLQWRLLRLIFNLQKLRLDTVFYPNYSRRYTVDWLIRNISAKNKIAVDGDTINQPVEQLNGTNGNYSRLIKPDTAPLHEFDRNKQICEALTGESISIKSPVIDKSKFDIIPNNSIVIFTEASTDDKKWPLENVKALCRIITSELNIPVIISGGKDPSFDASYSDLPEGAISIASGLNLISLCETIGGARLLISNDTVAVHLGAALSVPTICIAKGDLYGRFVPYPEHISTSVHTVFPQGYIADQKNYNRYAEFNITDVPVEDVYQKVRQVLVGEESIL